MFEYMPVWLLCVVIYTIIIFVILCSQSSKFLSYIGQHPQGRYYMFALEDAGKLLCRIINRTSRGLCPIDVRVRKTS